ECAKLELTDSVSCLGFVTRRDLACLYKRAFAMVYPSFFGPDNLPPLEAMSYGCPVIAAAAEGVREQLGDAAILVPPEDDAAMARAVAQIAHNGSIRAALIERGLERTAVSGPTEYVQTIAGKFEYLERVRRCWN